jgi:hypothetical protein
MTTGQQPFILSGPHFIIHTASISHATDIPRS